MHEGKHKISRGENGLLGLIIGTKKRRRKIMGHGENKSAASAHGENRMHEGGNKM